VFETTKTTFLKNIFVKTATQAFLAIY